MPVPVVGQSGGLRGRPKFSSTRVPADDVFFKILVGLSVCLG